MLKRGKRTSRGAGEVLRRGSDGRKLVLHVGCGPYNPENLHERFRDPGWREVRLDIDSGVQPDIVGTIVSMPDVPTGAVDAVWSSHNLEHVYSHEVPVVLREFLRVLSPRGFALITVPDLRNAARSIAKGQLEEALYVSPAGPISALDMVYGHRAAIQRGNEYMAHRTGFTARSLSTKLSQAGFEQVSVTDKADRALWAEGRKAA
jgi:SAM-dependent methyltransferase